MLGYRKRTEQHSQQLIVLPANERLALVNCEMARMSRVSKAVYQDAGEAASTGSLTSDVGRTTKLKRNGFSPVHDERERLTIGRMASQLLQIVRPNAGKRYAFAWLAAVDDWR